MIEVDREELRVKVQAVYQKVAEEPRGEFHFELGRVLALKLGYPGELLEQIPPEALESFAGVGYHLDLAALEPGEAVLDLGSGSGTDTFGAVVRVGPHGRVVGLDMTEAQRQKAHALKERAGFAQVEFCPGYIEEMPFADGSFDAVISNGVINLVPDKARVFREAARVLRPGGRLAISDIVSELEMPPSITCNSNLWASCIGGAMQQDAYRRAVEEAGLKVVAWRENPQYAFLSKSAQGASRTYGVKSFSLLAVKG